MTSSSFPDILDLDWSLSAEALSPEEWRITVTNASRMTSSFIASNVSMKGERFSVHLRLSVEILSFVAQGSTQLNPGESVDFLLRARVTGRGRRPEDRLKLAIFDGGRHRELISALELVLPNWTESES